MKGQNTQSDSKVRPGTVLAIVMNILAIGLMVTAMAMTSGCEPMETDTDGGALMDEDSDSETDGDDGYLPPLNIAAAIANPNDDISVVAGNGIIIVDPASCDKVAYITGDWYFGDSEDMILTITATPSTGNTCKVNFSGFAAFGGDFFGTTLPLVREGSCGWHIVTVLSDGNLLQSGYA